MFNYNLGGFNGIFKLFGIYAILDLALIRSRYSILLRYHEKRINRLEQRLLDLSA